MLKKGQNLFVVAAIIAKIAKIACRLTTYVKPMFVYKYQKKLNITRIG